jgi:hypothetical protein
MPATFDDNSTVIGESSRDPLSAARGGVPEEENLKGERASPAETRRKGKTVERSSDFMQPMHVPEKGRPFFVSIGRGGVIAALDELDKQLNAVSASYFMAFVAS